MGSYPGLVILDDHIPSKIMNHSVIVVSIEVDHVSVHQLGFDRLGQLA